MIVNKICGFILLYGLIEISAVNAQDCNCPLPIRLDEDFNQAHIRSCKDTLSETNKKISFMRFKAENCKGKLYAEFYTIDSTLISKGNYIESLDTFKILVLCTSYDGLEEEYCVYEYFEPLKSGRWIERNNKGELIEINYHNGLEIKKR